MNLLAQVNMLLYSFSQITNHFGTRTRAMEREISFSYALGTTLVQNSGI